MYLSGRPLLDNPADQALFVGRAGVLRQIDRALHDGLNCLLAGEPGSGKTSLIRALMFQTRDEPIHYVYVRGNEARTAGDLLTLVLQAASAVFRDADADSGRGRQAIELVANLARMFSEAREASPGLRVVVLEDVSAAAGTELFGALRDEVWRIDAVWLVTTSTAQLAGLVRPPADVFFEAQIDLGPLGGAEAAELLRRRMDQPIPDEQAEIVEATAASAPQTPRRLLDLARELAAAPDVGAARLNTVRGLRERSAALERLSRPARMLAQELEAMGWAAASDDRLLTRMAWTRPRVVQVVAELEKVGLVEMREESSGRGRPRKLYRLTPTASFVPTDPSPVRNRSPAGRAAAGLSAVDRSAVDRSVVDHSAVDHSAVNDSAAEGGSAETEIGPGSA